MNEYPELQSLFLDKMFKDIKNAVDNVGKDIKEKFVPKVNDFIDKLGGK